MDLYSNITKSHLSSPPPYSSPQDATTSTPISEGLAPRPESRPDEYANTKEVVNDSLNHATDVTAATKSTAEQLAEAKAQIAALTAQVKEATSQRSMGQLATDTKGKISAGVTSIGRTSQVPEGVPVKL